MKNPNTDKANTTESKEEKDLDTEIEDVIKVAEKKPSIDLGDGYRIWRCNGLQVGVHFHKKRS